MDNETHIQMLRSLVLLLCVCMYGWGQSLPAQSSTAGMASAHMVLSHDTLLFWNATIVCDSIRPLTEGGYYTLSAAVTTTHQAGIPPFFPSLDAPNVTAVCRTNPPSMKLSSFETGDSIILDDGKTWFWGVIHFKENEVVGHGSIQMGNFALRSDSIVFQGGQAWIAHGATVGIYRNKCVNGELLVDAHGAEVEYHPDQQTLTFKAGTLPWGGIGFLSKASWQTTLLSGTYHLDSRSLDLRPMDGRAMGSIYPLGSRSESIQLLLSGLHFSTLDQRIVLEGAHSLSIADAKIIPDSGRVIVMADGRIQDLHNATLTCNRVTGYHRFYNADVHIESDRQYTATAQYDYPVVKARKQEIPFNLRVQGDTMTIGESSPLDRFYLNEGIIFRGKLSLAANAEYLRAIGEIKVDFPNPYFATWFKADLPANPDSIILPMQSQWPSLQTGLHFDSQRRVPYTTFLTVPRRAQDHEVMNAGGAIAYDRLKGGFRMGQLAKLPGQDLRGTTALMQGNGALTLSGKMDFPFEMKRKLAKMNWAGEWREDSLGRLHKTNLVAEFDIPAIPMEAWEALWYKAAMVTAINASVDWEDPALLQGLAELLDPNPGMSPKNMLAHRQQVKNADNYTDIKPAEVHPVSLMLAGLEFRYDPEDRALWCAGEIGLLGIGGRSIGKRTNSNSKLEYIFDGGKPGQPLTDTLRIYLEFDEMNWVFFECYGDVVRTASSDIDGYNHILKAPDRPKGIHYVLTDEAYKDVYLVHFVNRYIWRSGRGRGW